MLPAPGKALYRAYAAIILGSYNDFMRVIYNPEGSLG